MNPKRLAELEYFDQMSPEEIVVIAGAMNEDAWWDGSTIVQQGDQGGGIYFVLEGDVGVQRRLYEGEIVTVGRLGRGAVFGILSVLDGVPRAATCIAEGSVRCAVMSRKDFMDLMEGGSTLALRFQRSVLQRLARDIRSTNNKLAELVALDNCIVTFDDLVEMFPELDEAEL